MNSLRPFIRKYRAHLHHVVWELDPRTRPLRERFVIRALRIAYAVSRDLADGQLSLWAMSLAYTTVISLVPLLAASFSVLKGFGVHNQLEPLLEEVLQPLGDQRFEIIAKIIEFVDNVKVGVLGALGLTLLVYSVVAMVHKVERSFNYTWHISQSRTLARRFSDYLSVLLVGPFLIFSSVGLAASISARLLDDTTALAPLLRAVVQFSGVVVPYVVMVAGFTFIYVFVPNTRVRTRSALVGGAVTAVAWKTMGWIFGLVVANSANTTAIYSAFASAIVFLVWLYLGWLVLLIGASISFYHQNSRITLARRTGTELSHAARERLALAILVRIGRAFAGPKDSTNVAGLSAELCVPVDGVRGVVDMLVEAGWLVHVDDDSSSLHPARPLKHIELAAVLADLHERVLDGNSKAPELAPHPQIDDLLEAVDAGRADACDGRTLADLCTAVGASEPTGPSVSIVAARPD